MRGILVIFVVVFSLLANALFSDFLFNFQETFETIEVSHINFKSVLSITIECLLLVVACMVRSITMFHYRQ